MSIDSADATPARLSAPEPGRRSRSLRSEAPRARTRSRLAREVVAALGGRFSVELGLDVDNVTGDVDRWFLAATLFGARIPATIARRTFRTLEAAGVATIVDAGRRSWDDLVALLDAGGYARYDYRTATRLQALARSWEADPGSRPGALSGITDREELAAALDALPGWGPVTVRIFLRELRGSWPGATLPIDPRASDAARHLGLLDRRVGDGTDALGVLAGDAGLDMRDLEAALIRLSFVHRRRAACPGGRACEALLRHQQGHDRGHEGDG